MTRDELSRYRRVTVMGLGLFGGGAGAARYFAELGAQVTVTDMASAETLAGPAAALSVYPNIEFIFGEHRLPDFTETDAVLANQAVRPDNPYLQATRSACVPVLTETGLALAMNRSPWIGVTGSSGKSTTTALLADMLQRHDPETLLGGNIGGDLITRVSGRPETSPVAAELSSFQLFWMKEGLRNGDIPPPRIAVITNITPNHLDWHGSMEEYAAAKRNLLLCQPPDCFAVLNWEDPLLREWAAACPARVIRCAHNDPGGPDACFAGGAVLRLGGEEVFRLDGEPLRLIGRHNSLNAAQASAAAWLQCGSTDAVRAGRSGFAGLPHRLENAGVTPGGTVFINDSKATTPEAALTALAAVSGPAVLIAGGYDKQSPFGELGRVIQERAAGAVLLGASADRIREAVLDAAHCRPAGMADLALRECGDDFDAAVTAAFSLLPDGGTVLLSPACASWGMFTNYEERGARFRAIAKTLGAEC